MLDTIVLILEQRRFSIRNDDRFSPSAAGIFQQPYYRLGSRGYFNCIQNPTKTDMDNGLYKPRLTLVKRMREGGFYIYLRIEFSIPKLLHGNNFDEVTNSDFQAVIERLHKTLSIMGVDTDPMFLEEAEVSSIHFSKNIPFTDYTTCSMIIRELGKLDLNKKLDLTEVGFRNGGSVIKMHANSYEIAIYDKIKDLERAKTSSKRAIDKDDYCQLNLFDRKNHPKQFQVLRIEARIGSKAKLKALLDEIGEPSVTSFGGLFSSNISQKILLHYWDKITVGMKLSILAKGKPEDIYSAIRLAKGNKLKPTKILQLVGALVCIDSIGARGLRALLSDSKNEQTWFHLKRELKNINLSKAEGKFSVLASVSKRLEEFKPLRLKDYVKDPEQPLLPLLKLPKRKIKSIKKKRKTRKRD